MGNFACEEFIGDTPVSGNHTQDYRNYKWGSIECGGGGPSSFSAGMCDRWPEIVTHNWCKLSQGKPITGARFVQQ